MLKIKDSVDLKELEKYGFKPLYNQHTGDLQEMYYVFTTFDDEKICVKKRNKESEAKDFLFKHKWDFSKKKYVGYYLYAFVEKGYVEEYAHILYDLIKDGLVEKVED